MPVKCDRCDNEATCHEVMIKNGKRLERHLCESCAKAEGMGPQAHVPITQLLNQYITSQMHGAKAGTSGEPSAAALAGTCPACGTTLNQFRQTGLLGCPECYAAFEGQLSPLLQRAHEGGTHHTGKQPRRRRGAETAQSAPTDVPSGGPRGGTSVAGVEGGVPVAPVASTAAEVQSIKAALAEAVAAERYEDAARLRDELLKLETQAAPKPARRAAKAARPKDAGPGAGGVGGGVGGGGAA